MLQRKLGYSRLTGVDYSDEGIRLAEKIDEDDESQTKIEYRSVDMCTTECPTIGRCDVITDKGTLDAISLAEDGQQQVSRYVINCRRLLADDGQNAESKRFVVYFAHIALSMLQICSCNFTESELAAIVETHGFVFDYAVAARQTFEFGGQKGQTCVVCVFRLT